MKFYDEKTGLEIENPDLEKGCVYPGRRKVGTEERVLEGTVYRCKQDNCVWDATGLPSAWEEVKQ